MNFSNVIGLFLVVALGACMAPAQRHDGTNDKIPERRGGKEPTDGDYWALRYTYPTMQFDSRWMFAAKEHHDAMQKGKPAGVAAALQRWRAGEDAAEGANLPPDQFTSLGPRPLDAPGVGFGRAAGRVNTIVTHPTNPAIAYLGSDGGGIWKTVDCCDSNTTWASLNDDPLFNSIAIGDLHLDPNDPEIVYGGTGDLRYGSYSFGSAGLLRSKDGGATWEILGADVFNPVYGQPPGVFPQYQAIGKVRVDPNDSETIVVGTKTGLFISYNDGMDWTGPCLTNAFPDQRQDTTGLELMDLGLTTGIIAAIGTRGAPTPVQPDLSENGANGVYKGTLPASGCPSDWVLTSTAPGWPAGTGEGNPDTNIVGRIELAVAPSNPDVIYAEAITDSSLSVLGVWKSTDGGDSWTQQAVPGDLGGCAGPGGQGWYDAGITVDPNDPDVVFLSDIDLYRSDNGADSFTNITCGYGAGMPSGDQVHVDQHARAFVNGDSSRLLIGNDGGVYYTGNADVANPRSMVFTQLNDTLSTIEFYSGDITANFNESPNPGVVGGAQDNGSSVATWAGTPGEAVWTGVWGGDGIYARIEPINEQRWYVESQRGFLAISQTGPNGGYQSMPGPWVSQDPRRPFLFPFEINKHDCPLSGCVQLIAGSYRVWETVQGGIPGSSWYINSPDLTKNALADRSIINQLAFAISDGSIAIVGTNDGNVQYGFGLGQGVANSATWVNVTDANAVLPNRPILDVFTDPVTATTAYAAVGGFDENTPMTPGHVFRVICNADCSSFEWQNKSGNLPNIPVNSIAVNPRNPKQVFAGTDWGLYFTDDIDQEEPAWMRFNDGLPSVMIWDMAIDRGFTTLALFTRSRGAYVWPLAAPMLEYSSGFE